MYSPLLVIGALLVRVSTSAPPAPFTELTGVAESQASAGVECIQIATLPSQKNHQFCYDRKGSSVITEIPYGLADGISHFARLKAGQKGNSTQAQAMPPSTWSSWECLELAAVPQGPKHSFCYDVNGKKASVEVPEVFAKGLTDAFSKFAQSGQPQPSVEIPSPQPTSSLAQPQPSSQSEPSSHSALPDEPRMRHCLPMKLPTGELQRICFPDVTAMKDLPLGCLEFKHTYGPTRNRVACFASSDDDLIDTRFEQEWANLVESKEEEQWEARRA